MGRPEGIDAMTVLGNGLFAAEHYEDALPVQEAELAMKRRLGRSEGILVTQTNLSNTYSEMGRLEEALQMDQDIYRGRVKFNGEEHKGTFIAANNYADSLVDLQRFKEAKSLLRKTMPAARRVFGAGHDDTLRMRWT